jgi:hypothetical protein
MTATVHKPRLGYRFEFAVDETEAAARCTREHGFAVLRRVLPADRVERLKASVRETLLGRGPLAEGETRFNTWFVEESPEFLDLLRFEPYTRILRALRGPRPTIVRTASLAKAVGAPIGNWHTDFSFNKDGPPRNSGDVLNSGEFDSVWCYLNGTHPDRAGIAVIPDSHTMDWQGPEGFAFTEGRYSFYPRGDKPQAYARMDVPGMLPVITEPGDVIIFNGRTYHGVFPHHGSEIRLTCGLGVRSESTPMNPPWAMPERGRRFLAGLPEELRPWFAGYPSIDENWGASKSAKPQA